ncbi:hypothetical protein SBD_7392 [Streptomyces bottropensis ATCC 25435]|uniref:Uncharacterized protein n=1 Tax=Streptomyces bottropensis ATCC 25435 TaxID=1054862 RepID=M3D655_9ACTN|nr:hypothetical protein SBD_7392 [Streptomyces bottropensis ATCC 25435]
MSLLPTHTYLEAPEAPPPYPRRTGQGELSVLWGRLPPSVRQLKPRHPVGEVGRLAGFLRSTGIFGARRSSFCTGIGGGTGHRPRTTLPGGVNQRKSGTSGGPGLAIRICWSTGGGE